MEKIWIRINKKMRSTWNLEATIPDVKELSEDYTNFLELMERIHELLLEYKIRLEE